MTLSLVHKILCEQMPEDLFRRGFAGKEDEARSAMAYDRKRLAASVVISIDDVADFYCQSDKTFEKPSDFPCCAPSFTSIAFQWTYPPYMSCFGKQVPTGDFIFNRGPKGQHTGPQMVVQCDSIEMDDKLRKALSSWISERNDRQHLTGARWVLRMTPWEFYNRKPMWFGYGSWTLVDAEGIATHSWLSSQFPNTHRMLESMANETGTALLHLPLLALSFLNCRNIVVADESSERNPTPDMQRKLKVPRLTFKRLAIAPMREVLRNEGQSENVGLGKALHICRGHFARYENGVFNRSPGQTEVVWRPQHVRGSVENGLALKDYSVVRPVQSGGTA